MIKNGDIYDISELKFSDSSDSPLYPGDISVENNKRLIYVINSHLSAWKYGITLFYNKKQLIVFCAHVFKKNLVDPNKYTCISTITSPPFKLCSSRRASQYLFDLL